MLDHEPHKIPARLELSASETVPILIVRKGGKHSSFSSSITFCNQGVWQDNFPENPHPDPLCATNIDVDYSSSRSPFKCDNQLVKTCDLWTSLEIEQRGCFDVSQSLWSALKHPIQN